MPSNELDRESLLLLYAANELGPSERVHLERQLNANPALRQKLSEIEQAQLHLSGAMAEMDARAQHSGSSAASIRRVLREMNQWQVDRLKNGPPPVTSRLPRFGWTVYSIATAAAILLGIFIWWSRVEDRPDASPDQLAGLNSGSDEIPSAPSSPSINSAPTVAGANLRALTPEESQLADAITPGPPEGGYPLADAERQIRSLSVLSSELRDPEAQ